MNKKNLLNEINAVIEKNNALFSKCSELENLLSEKDSTINFLEEKINSLNTEIAALNDEYIKLKTEFESIYTEPSTETVEKGIKDDSTIDLRDAECELSVDIYANKKTVVDEEKTSEPIFRAQPKLSLPNEEDVNNILNVDTKTMPSLRLSSASESIGRVVVKCAEISNIFATTGDINSKDLINLALGRTEVFKSEVLSLATDCNLSDDMFFAEIRVKETSVIEYFDLLLKQI